MNDTCRFGVINWDACYPDTYFGYYAMNSLGNERYRGRLPYYTLKTERSCAFPERTQEQYDRELQYAAEAGIDYFAYCWYTDEETEPLDPRVDHASPIRESLHELNTARKLYQSSPMNRRINMAAIILGGHGYVPGDFEALCDAMEKPYYERIGGRPLVFLFAGYDEAMIRRIKEPAKRRGMDPYICFFNNGVEPCGSCGEADAVSTYAEALWDARTERELLEKIVARNEERLKYGLKVLTTCPCGWDPNPRIDHPVPWCGYKQSEGRYMYDHGNGEAWEYLMRGMREWAVEHADRVVPGHMLSFAWNEFEEGGWICPTLNDDGSVNDARVRAFRKATDGVRSGAVKKG